MSIITSKAALRVTLDNRLIEIRRETRLLESKAYSEYREALSSLQDICPHEETYIQVDHDYHHNVSTDIICCLNCDKELSRK